MYLQITITLFLLLSVMALFLLFFKKKNAMFRIHNQNILDLESAICNNRNQINYRNSNLNRYNFLKYNLNEALLVQHEIKI